MNTANINFWKGKNVLITGHTGFKGSWLCLWLESMGANLFGLSLPPKTNPTLFEVANVQKGVKNYYGDIIDYGFVLSVLKKSQPQIIIHMAAQSLVRESYDKPLDTFRTNFLGTLNLLESARQTGTAKVIINVTTDKCYSNKEWSWGYREIDELGGYDPYSNSKACSELLSDSYRKSFYSKIGIALATVRAGNVIGGGDWSTDRLIPDIIRAWSKKSSPIIRNPNSIRPWQFVLEPLRGYLILAEKLYNDGAKFSQPWNFGPYPYDILDVKSVLEKMSNFWGGAPSWDVHEDSILHETQILKLDISKAERLLKWSPVVNIDESLQLVVQWYKMYLQEFDMRDFTFSQIENYQNKF